MKKIFTGIALWVAISLVSPGIVRSQRLSPSYLGEMPAPSRVVAEIGGKDAADACARQMGAFMALIKMIGDMADGLEHRSDRQLTADEQRIMAAYQKAYADVWHKMKDTYGKQYAGDYDHDRDLLVEVLDKFFSESFRTQFFRVNGFAAAWYKKVHANGGSSGTVVSKQNPSSTNGPDARPARGNDPSIAKAREAHVDTTVYGLQVGEPLRLPTCPSGTGRPGAAPVPATCFYEEDALSRDLGEIFGGDANEPVRDPHETWRTVYVRNGPRLFALLYDGLLATVHLDTGGINDDPGVSKELRQKYGPPTVVKPITYTPRIGNALKADDLEWRLPGLHVEYSAALKKGTTVISVDGGSVTIETEAAYQRRLAIENEKEKSKTKL